MNQILVVEDEPVIRGALRKLLERHDFQVTEADSVQAACQQALDSMALIISDLRLPDAPGTDLIAHAGTVPVIIMTSYASLRSAVDAMKLGAVDYIAKPFNHDEMLLTVERILKEQQQQRRARALNADVERSFPNDITCDSAVMQTLLRQIDKLAPSDTSLLLTGESGTGKELIARIVHRKSLRQQAPMIAFNCTAIGGDRQEAELFGFTEGTFDDPPGASRGLVEEAHNGTLFIDEVGDLTRASQSRLLHLIDRQENLRVGAIKGSHISIRLIVSSQKNLTDRVKNGDFREDLYYRIKGAELLLPALRDRGDDILPLANSLLSRTVERLNSADHYFNHDAISAMARYRWPGNVRELANAIERAVILAETAAISPELLGITASALDQQLLTDSSQEELSLKEYFTRFVLENQDKLTETALARKLGISRKCLWDRRQRFGLERKKG